MQHTELLDKAAFIAFEHDVHGFKLEQTVAILDALFREQLTTEYNYTGTPPAFNETMVQTMIDFETIRYMMATAKNKKVDTQP